MTHHPAPFGAAHHDDMLLLRSTLRQFPAGCNRLLAFTHRVATRLEASRSRTLIGPLRFLHVCRGLRGSLLLGELHLLLRLCSLVLSLLARTQISEQPQAGACRCRITHIASGDRGDGRTLCSTADDWLAALLRRL